MWLVDWKGKRLDTVQPLQNFMEKPDEENGCLSEGWSDRMRPMSGCRGQGLAMD